MYIEMCPLLPVLAPTEDENEPDISIDDNGDIGVVVVILAVDNEAAESIETCQPTELSLFLFEAFFEDSLPKIR